MVVVMPSLHTPLRIRVHEQDERRFTLTLREYGSTTGKDVSAYTNIYFEWENANGVVQAPIALSSITPGATWASGVVVVELGAGDVTATPGDCRFGITLVKMSGATTIEERTVMTGVVEVADRAADSFTITP